MKREANLSLHYFSSKFWEAARTWWSLWGFSLQGLTKERTKRWNLVSTRHCTQQNTENQPICNKSLRKEKTFFYELFLQLQLASRRHSATPVQLHQREQWCCLTLEVLTAWGVNMTKLESVFIRYEKQISKQLLAQGSSFRMPSRVQQALGIP